MKHKLTLHERSSMLPTRQRFMAYECFLLAALLVLYVGAYFYLDGKYPTSAKFIQMNLSSPSIASQSNVEEAKKAGYSEKEIAEYLAQRNLQTFQTYLKMILRIELTIFVTSLIACSGFTILKMGSKRRKEDIIMKKCPFCAEEIQDDAIKCKHCGEWLKREESIQTEASSSGSFVSTPHVEQPSVTKSLISSLKLKEISFTKLIVLIMLIPASLMLYDGTLTFAFSKLFKEIAEGGWLIICILHFSYGVWLADYIYKIKKVKIIIVFSFVALFLYRSLFISIYNPSLISEALISTLKEEIVVYLSLAFFSYLFRYFERKFDYAEITDVFESKDPITKKKYDSGTCSKCGGITIIGRERSHPYLGKSSEYFCDNCNRFLRGNPLNNIFLGLTESASSLLFMLGIASSMQGNTSSYSSIFMLLLFVGIYDGIKRLCFGISGVKRSSKKYTTG